MRWHGGAMARPCGFMVLWWHGGMATRCCGMAIQWHVHMICGVELPPHFETSRFLYHSYVVVFPNFVVDDHAVKIWFFVETHFVVSKTL